MNVKRQEFSVAPVVSLTQLKSTLVGNSLYKKFLKAGLDLKVNS